MILSYSREKPVCSRRETTLVCQDAEDGPGGGQATSKVARDEGWVPLEVYRFQSSRRQRGTVSRIVKVVAFAYAEFPSLCKLGGACR
jgi:hypothetical protein